MGFTKNGSPYDTKKYQSIDNTTRQLILVGIASEINFQHNHQIIHIDIMASYVLHDDSFYPKISSFLSFFLEQDKKLFTQIGGTLFY